MPLLRHLVISAVLALAAAATLPLPPAPALAQGRINLSLDVGDGARGGSAPVTVNLSVNRNPVTLRRLSVTVRGIELVDLTHTIPEEKDKQGKQITPSRNITVKKEQVIYEKTVTIVAGQELPAGSHHKFNGDVEIPAEMPPSFKGKFARIKWEAYAATDMPGGFLGLDPATSWQEFTVK